MYEKISIWNHVVTLERRKIEHLIDTEKLPMCAARLLWYKIATDKPNKHLRKTMIASASA
jgi:hypothetical protein